MGPSWSSQQVEALDAIDDWLDRRTQPFFYLAGYAGNGKSASAPLERGFIALSVKDEEGHRVEVVAPQEGFPSKDASGSDLPQQPFAFGCAITCHKAQGSQWHFVPVVDESAVFRRTQGALAVHRHYARRRSSCDHTMTAIKGGDTPHE
jgi:hypothetical protein